MRIDVNAITVNRKCPSRCGERTNTVIILIKYAPKHCISASTFSTKLLYYYITSILLSTILLLYLKQIAEVDRNLRLPEADLRYSTGLRFLATYYYYYYFQIGHKLLFVVNQHCKSENSIQERETFYSFSFLNRTFRNKFLDVLILGVWGPTPQRAHGQYSTARYLLLHRSLAEMYWRLFVLFPLQLRQFTEYFISLGRKSFCLRYSEGEGNCSMRIDVDAITVNRKCPSRCGKGKWILMCFRERDGFEVNRERKD
ncbi:hypothetical protein CEXT_507281 [Caerostris extrusa]|uniref:Uncharacterized protein n=1 Tax=Caerostris extrusa TaxID=172846 RepID=A0AAV4M8Q7_CAEEX|nr:hypothetical protein CEXT_507281 [Caerostris extrusa]